MPAKPIHWLPLAAMLALTPLPAIAGDELPDADLLEFLASWMDDEGGFIDPLQFEKVPLSKQSLAPSEPSDLPDKDNDQDGNNGDDRG